MQRMFFYTRNSILKSALFYHPIYFAFAEVMRLTRTKIQRIHCSERKLLISNPLKVINITPSLQVASSCFTICPAYLRLVDKKNRIKKENTPLRYSGV